MEWDQNSFVQDLGWDSADMLKLCVLDCGTH